MTESLIMRPDEREIVRDILQQYVAQYPVWAFGSRVNGNPKPYSDLDLAVITQTPLSPAVYADLIDAFSNSDLPWKVDIVDWAMIQPAFRDIIRQKYSVLQP
ncbi:nucleotidyltransferase family protein [Testudinibacter sp. P27/CKL/0425]